MRIVPFLLLLAMQAVPLHGQSEPPVETQPAAPIERRNAMPLPNAPQPAPTQAQLQADKEWNRLIRQTHYTRPEMRIQAVGDSIRCDVDKVTPAEVFCTEHRVQNGPLMGLLRPKETYHIPRREIREVRVGGREMSTLLGAGIGIGVGVGIGSINEASRADGAQAICALLLGGLGALIGHALPLAGHPVYQQP